jgi:hypothetical protein
VFRVPETRVRGHAPVGGLLGLVGGIAATLAFPWITTGLSLAITFAALATGFAAGRTIGGVRRLYRCATCESFLDATAAVCPGCGGTVAGEIARRGDRLDVEDRLETENRLAAGQSHDEPSSEDETAGPPR